MTENDKRCPNCTAILDTEWLIVVGECQQHCECGNLFVIERNIALYTGDLEINGELFHLFYVPMYGCLKCRGIIAEWKCRCLPFEEAHRLYLEAQKQLQQYAT